MYHIVYKKIYRYDRIWLGRAGTVPAKTDTREYEDIINTLPALHIADLMSADIAQRAYDPTTRGKHMGQCYDIEYEITFAQELDETEAARVRTRWDEIIAEQDAYEAQRIQERKDIRDARERERAERRANRWWRRAWRWVALHVS